MPPQTKSPQKQPTIDIVAGDNIINASEQNATITGTCEAGATISLDLGGNICVAAVTGTTWSYTLTAADITAMGGPDIKHVKIEAIQTDINNKTSKDSLFIDIDTIAPGLPIIDVVAGDDIISVSEQATTVITGTCEAGATVALSIGGNTRPALMGNGQNSTTWSYTLTAADIIAMGQGSETISATQTDAAGNISNLATHDIIIATAPTINPVATDDIINTSEQTSTINGTCEAGASVALSISGTSRAATVTGTTWSYTLAAADIAAMGQGAETISATQTIGGNTSVAVAHDISIDTLRPTATIVVADTALKAGETSDVTITFSEAVTDFANADLTIEGGSLSDVASADGGITWTAIFTPTADITDSSNLISLNNAGVMDLAGNAGVGVTESNNYAIDTLRPTASIVVADSALKAGEISGVTITFSEAVTDFANADLTIEGGSLTEVASADGGLTWTATFTPTADITDSTNLITLDNAGVLDLAGNTGVGTTQSNNYAIDTQRPTASIVVADPALAAGETSGVIITFSEAVTGFFNDDLTIEGGSLSDVASADGGITWTATFTPTTDITDTTNLITLNNAGIADAAGNAGVEVTQSNNYAIDTQRPTASIVVADTALKAGEITGVTITFSEAMTDFTNTDLTIEGGSLTEVASADGGLTWTATFTPTADITDNANLITLDNAGVLDLAGNTGVGTTQSNNYTIDTQRPNISSVAITSNAGADNTYTLGDVISVTATYNEAVIVAGNPIVTLNIGGVNRTATYASGSGSNSLVFNYTVQAGDIDSNGVSIAADSLGLNGGAVTDAVGNNAILTHSAVIDNASHRVMGMADTNTSPPAVDLSAIASGTGGFVINGQAGADYSGWSVSSAGDVNGDGLADLIVGAFLADDTTAVGTDAGRSYVVFGKADTTEVDLSAVASGTGGFAINGHIANYRSGYSVSSAGDVNGDGLADLIVGVRSYDYPPSPDNTERSYVVFGKADTTAVDLAAVVSGTGGFVVTNGQPGYMSGWSVSSAGDVNGDGLADLIIGGPNSLAGRSYVVFGKADTTAVDLSGVASGTGGFVINGQTWVDMSGYSVSSAGDVNGDGLADLIVGAYGADPTTGSTEAGRSYVVFGKADTTAVALSAVASGTGGFVINGQTANDYSGWSVSSAGDVNGDGLADLIVGAPWSDTAAGTDAGRSYVVFGKSNTTAVNLSAIASGTGGFVINGEVGEDNSGYSVSSAGDVNGDGLADLIVGAPWSDPAAGNLALAGRSYVVFGKTDTMAVDLSAVASGAGGFVINGQARSDYNGYSVSSAGDVNGDGLADLIVGAYGARPATGVDAGRSYVIFGGQQFATTVDYLGDTSANNLTGTATAETFAAGDGNDTIIGNGGADVMMGGKGDDVFVINDSNITALASNYGAGGNVDQLAMLDGGSGFDTIRLSDGATLDLTAISNIGAGGIEENSRIESIEKIDLSTDTAANTLILTAKDVLDMAGMNQIHTGLSADGKTWANISGTPLSDSVALHQLVIDGTAADSINFSDSWTNTGTASDGTNTYTVYNAATTAAQLLIEQGVMVNNNGVELSAIAAGTGGFVINGQAAYDLSGWSVSSAGDVNGDGLTDIIVGAYWANSSAGLNTGRSYVIFGKTDTTAIDLSDIADGTDGFVINGLPGSLSGWSVSSAGDVNGDGLADLITGSPGNSYVVFGKASTTAVNLSAVAAGTGGFVINGQATTDQSGISVSSAGDVNGDGLTDLIVGAPHWSNPTSGVDVGRSYVVFGKSSTTAVNLSAVASGTGGFVINGQAAADYSGCSVSSAGDINGDGLADLIVGAYNSDPAAGADAGCSYVVFGKTSTTAVNLSAIADGTGGFVINGQTALDWSGWSVSSAGDVNGDGLADLIVGTYPSNPASELYAGRSYVVFGKTGTTAIDLSVIDGGTGGFVINGQATGDTRGYSVSSAGDVNGDGLADLIVGTPNSDSAAGTSAGRSYVVYGKTSTTAVDLSVIVSGTGGFVINGQTTNDYSGISVSSAGDVNGDGLADLIVGAFYSNSAAGSNAGRSYVIFGGQQFATTVDYLGDTSANNLTGTATAETFAAGDGNDTITGNGGADVMMGGKGDDVFVVNDSNITALASNYGAGGNVDQLAMLDGGSGFDTIRLSDGANLDLTAISNIGAGGIEENSRIESIEKIDLSTDTAGNILTLTAKDVLDMAGMNQIHTGLSADGKTWSNISGAPLSDSVALHQLVIDGTAADSINFSDSWTNTGTASDGTNTYTVYNAATTAAQLLIEQGVMVNTGVTPLVLDLDGNGVHTNPVTHGAIFDIDANGQLDRTGWTDGKDGLLALDINNDGIINDASELFGEGTQVADGKANDGYQALSQYDSDGNGIINSSDAIFSQLNVWQDRNIDGVTDSGELMTLADLGIASLDLHAQTGTQIDNGNTLGLVSSYTIRGGEKMSMADVRFQTDGSYLTADEMNRIVQDMASYAVNEGIAMGSGNDAGNNELLMTIVAPWHTVTTENILV